MGCTHYTSRKSRPIRIRPYTTNPLSRRRTILSRCHLRRQERRIWPYTKRRKPYRLIPIPFSFRQNLCVPDSCHALEQINFARDIVLGIGDLNKRIKESTDSITESLEWTTRIYPNGAKKQKFPDDKMKQIIKTITELDLHQQILPRIPIPFRNDDRIKGKGPALSSQHHTYQTWKATQPRPPTPPSPTPPSTSPRLTHVHGTRKSTQKSRTSSTTS